MSQYAWQLLLFLQVYVKHLVDGRKIDETLIAEFFSLFYRNSIGFALNLDGRSCVDVDECKENPRICNGGKCTNIEGGYICTCTDGLIPGKDGASCIGKSDRDLDKNLSFKNPRGSLGKKKNLVPRKFREIILICRRHRRVQRAAQYMRLRRMLQHDWVVQLSLRGRLFGETGPGTGMHRRRRVPFKRLLLQRIRGVPEHPRLVRVHLPRGFRRERRRV